jgi:hypothetical protein
MFQNEKFWSAWIHTFQKQIIIKKILICLDFGHKMQAAPYQSQM